MKKILTLVLLLPFLSLAQVGINTTAPKAALDVESTNNGMLIPRVQLTSTLDATTVVNPNAGPLETSTLVYNIAPAGVIPNNVVAGFYYWNGSQWIALSARSGWTLNGNTATTSPAIPATYGTSAIGVAETFLGTTDNNDVTIGTDNIERMRIKNTTGNVGIGTANPSTTLEIVSNGTTELKVSSRGAFGPSRFSMISDKELPDEWRPTFIESADNGFFTGRMDFFTNGTGITNKFGSVRAMSITNGKVGIGTTNPSEKLHVVDNSNLDKSPIISQASQVTAVTDYQNIAIKGIGGGSGASNYGFGNGVMGIGDRANSFYATGVYAHLGTTTPILPGTNQALYANGNGLGNAGIFMGGNVGINTQTPTLARLQVDGMEGNTTAIFRGNSTVSQGISMVADWPGVYFNSYYNGAIRQMSNSGYPTIINTDQSSGGLVFQTTNIANTTSGAAIASIPVRMTIAGNGNVGIGALTPSRLLHVNSTTAGAVRIVDGTQATNRVLTSDATGVATWRESALTGVQGNLVGAGSGISIPYTQTVGFLQTGSSITLPPGRFVVNVTMLLSVFPSISPNNSSFWLRTAFSDFNVANPTRTGDTVGSYYVSGNLPGSSRFSVLSGSVIINNTSGGNKTYYYIAGEVLTNNTTQSLLNYSGWGEDSIVAYRIN